MRTIVGRSDASARVASMKTVCSDSFVSATAPGGAG